MECQRFIFKINNDDGDGDNNNNKINKWRFFNQWCQRMENLQIKSQCQSLINATLVLAPSHAFKCPFLNNLCSWLVIHHDTLVSTN